MTVRSRRSSRQIRQVCCSDTFPQISQNCTPSLTLPRTSCRRPMSAGSALSRWKAIRWALLGPIPGSRPSSSIRSWTTPSYNCSAAETEAAEVRHAAAETTRQWAELLLGELLRVGRRVAHRRDDQVGQRLDVVGVDHL